MKKLIKAFIVLTLALSLTVLVACKKTAKIKIGILQYANHSALVQAIEGFQAGLTEAGYDETKVEYNVIKANGDTEATQTAANQLVATSDMIFVVATTATQIVKAEAEKQRVDTPIIFTAVTDPVKSGLITSMANPGGQITGVSDMNPMADQIAFMLKFKDTVTKKSPDATDTFAGGLKIGVFYTSSEPNSVAQAAEFKAKLVELGMSEDNIKEKTVADSTEIDISMRALAKDVDMVYIPTDNNIAANMGVVKQVILSTGVLVFGGEANQVTDGATMSLSVGYPEMGKQAAKQAVKILKGAKPASVAAEYADPDSYVILVNKTELDTLEFTIPSAVNTTAYPSLKFI